ncbi:hypothetical protein GCM10010123_33980 [Pilimelia anulata]|uniref:DUF2087 domain-containing protein n=1 Tax=Pilimelia anulata TaxID=53371 RepID=A0A8J3BG32_9ACTN|nr:DUF2087 domain-containing protein [Pilimelia anulata]GGK01196.1 hypothetical protein GCM10010123_33980 [Pilimelia anulata]
MKPEALCGLLAESDRLAVFAAVVLGARSPGEVARATGLPGRTVVVALGRLEQGGLVSLADGGLRAGEEPFREAVRSAGAAPPEPLDDDPSRAAVLRHFLRDGRIAALPVVRAKRRVVLEHVVVTFEPGVRYPEPAVDALLRAFMDDYATLRRSLIDEGLLGRDQGVYWRTGGPVDL